jgi:hypothetical protein
MIEALTVLALIVGVIDGIMTLVLLHREHEVEERLSRDELHEVLEDHHDQLFDRLIQTLLDPPRIERPSEPVDIPREPGTIRQDQLPSWWLDR